VITKECNRLVLKARRVRSGSAPYGDIMLSLVRPKSKNKPILNLRLTRDCQSKLGWGDRAFVYLEVSRDGGVDTYTLHSVPERNAEGYLLHLPNEGTRHVTARISIEDCEAEWIFYDGTKHLYGFMSHSDEKSATFTVTRDAQP
jgi:hypothetical protein